MQVPKRIGYHGHNNQQLGFANSVEAIITGVEMVDGYAKPHPFVDTTRMMTR